MLVALHKTIGLGCTLRWLQVAEGAQATILRLGYTQLDIRIGGKKQVNLASHWLCKKWYLGLTCDEEPEHLLLEIGMRIHHLRFKCPTSGGI
jgi:hypothetical protein